MEKKNTLNTKVRDKIQPSLFDSFTDEELEIQTFKYAEPADKYLVKFDDILESTDYLDSEFLYLLNSN